MKMKPIGDLILVKEQEQTKKRASGIIIPDGVEGDYIYAKVISIGNGLFTQTGNKIPMTVKVGDTVVLHKNQSGANKKIKLEEVMNLLSEIRLSYDR